MSVEHSPTRTTSAPWLVAPSPSASAIGAEDGRMSCPIASEPAPVSPMHARPMLRARSSSSCSGYSPRTSSALNTWSRSAGTGRLLGWTLLGTGRFASCRGPDRHGVPGDAKGALYSFGCARKRPAGPSRWRPGAHIVRWSVTIEEVRRLPRSRHARRPPRPRLTLPEVQPPGTGSSAFMRLVEAAVASIPPEFRERLENVEFVVEEIPNGDEVPGEGIPPGLYQGTPPMSAPGTASPPPSGATSRPGRSVATCTLLAPAGTWRTTTLPGPIVTSPPPLPPAPAPAVVSCADTGPPARSRAARPRSGRRRAT